MFNTKDSIKTIVFKKKQTKFDLRTNLENLILKKTQQEDKQQSAVFFNKKKILVVIGWGFFFCLLIFISINFLLDINWINLCEAIIINSTKPRFLFTVIFSASIFLFSDIWLQALGLKLRAGKQLNHLPFKEWTSFIIVSFFVQTITPFAIGSEAYAIWWFRKNKVELKEASAIVSVSTFCWFASQFLITWPSFIYITAINWQQITSLQIEQTYWLILVGLLVDATIWFIIVVISYSKHVHYYIAIFSNKLKKFFMLDYVTNSELNYQYLVDNAFQKIYIRKLASKITFFSVCLCLFQNFLVYALYACILTIFSDDQRFWDAYHTINVSTTANNFLPIPSAEGTLQLTIKKLSIIINKANKPGESNLAHSQIAPMTIDFSIFIWRFFCKYLGLATCFIFIVSKAIFGQTKQVKQPNLMIDTL